MVSVSCSDSGFLSLWAKLLGFGRFRAGRRFFSRIFLPLIGAQVWAQLIARLIIQRRIRSFIATSRLNAPGLISMLAIITIIAGMTLLMLMPTKINLVTHERIYDSQLFRLGIMFLLFINIPVITLCVLLAVERTIFFNDGIIHLGIPWAWSDFRTYAWKDHPKDSLSVELRLESEHTTVWWMTKTIQLQMAVEDKQRIDALLAEKIKRTLIE